MNTQSRLSHKMLSLLITALVIFNLAQAGVVPSSAAIPKPQDIGIEDGAWRPVIVRHDPTPSTHRVPAPVQFSRLGIKSATITINYQAAGETAPGGEICSTWPNDAKVAFNYAASIWESLINSSVPIAVDACWTQFSEAGVLGYGGSGGYSRDFAEAPRANTWYPVSLANALSNTDRNGSDPEIFVAYSKDFDWYFGTDGSTPANKMDFASIVLHELCHGLGFAGSMTVKSGLGYWAWGASSPNDYPVIYDRYAENGSGQSLLSFGNGTTALATQLTSNNLYFDGPQANAANSGSPPKLFAPSTWMQGSSYSHLDYDTFNDTPNALMVYAISNGESEHNPGHIALGLLEDIGWTITSSAPAPTVNSITPSSGPNEGQINITNLSGANFQTGATVKLTHSGQADINATDVNVVSDGQITCVFNLTGAETGAWNVVVTNPDAQSGTLPNGFTVTFSGKTWNGSSSSDWHTAANWSPTGIPTSGDHVLIPDVTRDPVISNDNAAVNNLTISEGAVLDLTDRTLTAEGTVTNQGTLKHTQNVVEDNTTEFLRITNIAGQVKYYGVEITPSSTAPVRRNLAVERLPIPSEPFAPYPRQGNDLIKPAAPLADVELTLDDGTQESNLVLRDLNTVTEYHAVLFNHYTATMVSSFPFALERIDIHENTNNLQGEEIQLLVYTDTDGGDPGNATLRYSEIVTVQTQMGWNVYTLTTPVLIANSADILVGFSTYYADGGVPWPFEDRYPYPMDETDPQGMSYAAYMNDTSDPVTPSDLSSFDNLIEMGDVSHPCNWMIRGYGSLAAPNTVPTLSDLPDQTVPINGSADNAIDLWAYASDDEDADTDLDFSITNAPAAGAGVTLDSNRYININPTTDWSGVTDVQIQVQDTGGLADTNSFTVRVETLTGPNIQVFPTSFDEAVRPEEQLTRTLTISNTGTEPLLFIIGDGAVSWLGEDPASGTVNAGGASSVDIVFNATGLAIGDYTTDLVINSNDSDNSPLTVPVAMHVVTNTPPVLSGVPDQIYFIDSVYIPLDLWKYASDNESPDDVLTFAIDNTPDPNAGITLDANRYIVINPVAGWTGETTVVVRVTDPEGLFDTDSFLVEVRAQGPNIEIAPTSFEESLEQDTQLTRTLTISNTGAEQLMFVLNDDGTAWLTEDPGSGFIAAGGTSFVNVTFDATGLAAGNYTADLTVSSNDPDESAITVPITMHVTGPEGTPVTVSVSGHQFCADRARGVKRCFDIETENAMNATVRFYFSEAERNGQALNSLLVWHYNGDWVEEPGPYLRGGTGDAQYVEAQNVDGFSLFALGGKGSLVYLPIVLKRYPPLPDIPVLNAISNADGDGDYTVSWNTAYLAQTYTLQEDDNPSFSSPTTAYGPGTATSMSITDKPTGIYYYRVRASNSWGNSGWSNIQSVSVSPPTRFYPSMDTTILQGVPGSNFGSATDMWAGYEHCSGSGNGVTRSLVKFDLSAVPSNAQITQAILSLYLVNSCDTGNRNHTVTTYRITSNWNGSSVTWNSSPSYSEAHGSSSVASRTYKRYTFDITALVRGWVNGSLPNYGLMLRGPESSGDSSARLGFSTLNASGTTYDPYINITYAGMTTTEDEAQAVEVSPILCGATIEDLLGIKSNAPNLNMFRPVGQATCTSD